MSNVETLDISDSISQLITDFKSEPSDQIFLSIIDL